MGKIITLTPPLTVWLGGFLLKQTIKFKVWYNLNYGSVGNGCAFFNHYNTIFYNV